ncbi:DUF995 domain-containing protein [Brucella intermedia]|uniref:DUF995 domain-containing protein n=1 Tax=Brucella intermedia TaxID=94625 RepID=UPI00124F72AD|nr:DUF995 domain-containing protein [Brucella intermedia]KAB2731537.1 DUF995 domain-containing protein [Brucella intermedia]
MLLKHFVIASAAMLALSLAGNASAALKPATDNTVSQFAAAASPMKGHALEKLYAGRTWKWKTGGGFFSSKKARGWFLSGEQKQFSAWSGKGAATTHATGYWYVTDGGKLCLRALWSSQGDSSGAVTCFLHREKNGVIYQKPALGGKWYVFAHNPVRKDDEIRKLVKGDRVGAEVARLKANRR